MKAKIPNLELLQYKVIENLARDEDFMEKFNKVKEKNKFVTVDVVLDTFLQVWGDTSGGFESGLAGQAFIEEYTTVAHERVTDTYIVCFGDKLCYKIDDPTEVFLEDLKNRQLKGLKSGKQVY